MYQHNRSLLLPTGKACARKLPLTSPRCSYRLNIWDVGGQKSLRSYWRNYYEQTDAMIWVVDSIDIRRMQVHPWCICRELWACACCW